jgi:hypothetical protein
MAITPAQEEFLAITRKSQEAVVAAIKIWVETVKTATPKLAPLTDKLPKLPQFSVPLADKLPGPEETVANAYRLAEQVLASRRKFAEDLSKMMTPLMPARVESAPASSPAESAPESPAPESVPASLVAKSAPAGPVAKNTSAKSTPARPAPKSSAAKSTTAKGTAARTARKTTAAKGTPKSTAAAPRRKARPPAEELHPSRRV